MSVLKVNQETPPDKEKIRKNDNIERYSGVLYGSNHFATCDILLSHKIIIIIDGLFMNWRSQIKLILAIINHKNNTNINIFNGYHTKSIQDLFNRHWSKNIIQWWTSAEETPEEIGSYYILLISTVLRNV